MAYEHPAWVEVDLDAIACNVRALKALTPARCAFMAVVKADGYGHGAAPVARAALQAGADRLGVATVEEAVRLRAAGITATVHLLSQPPESAAPVLVEHGIVATLFSREFALALSGAARTVGKTAPFHLKVDTGMSRIGVRAEHAPALARELCAIPGVRMEGVFTHFATADVPGDHEFSGQVERFDLALRGMRAAGVEIGIAHAANSAATILHPAVHHDMVRCGIALYGLHPAASTRGRIALVPAMAVKTRVAMVKRIDAGEAVSYGATYRATRPTTLATLPLGYADGVHRAASNRLRVLIGNAVCRQVGRVCMDQLMVAVPPGVTVEPGDEAVMVGTQGDQRIDLEELAEAAGTISYETACGFALRLPRRYLPPAPPERGPAGRQRPPGGIRP